METAGVVKILTTILLLLPLSAPALDEQRLATAIRHAEGDNPRWLYGIHHRSTMALGESEARKRCIATIEHAQARWRSAANGTPYLEWLARAYCPLNAQTWLKNVTWFYNHPTTGTK